MFVPPSACSQDIVCLILQYLQDEGYTTSFLTMQDETKVKLAEKQTQRSYFKRMRKFILGASAVARAACQQRVPMCLPSTEQRDTHTPLLAALYTRRG